MSDTCGLPIDPMLADAHAMLKRRWDGEGDELSGDLACDVLALAAEVERLEKERDALLEFVRQQIGILRHAGHPRGDYSLSVRGRSIFGMSPEEAVRKAAGLEG